MRLSEAIREGAKLRPQGFETFFKRDSAGILHSCALGAAVDAVDPQVAETPKDLGFTGLEVWDVDVIGMFPQVLWSMAFVCPECDGKGGLITVVGEHLNDEHRWTREAIADWLEGQGL